MDKNRAVLNHCPHFYTIVNFEYYSDDIVSEKLIDIYSKFIFSVDINIPENLEKVEKLDEVLYKYITDYAFREQVKSDMMKIKVRRGENLLDTVVSAILGFHDSYMHFINRKVQLTRWI